MKNIKWIMICLLICTFLFMGSMAVWADQTGAVSGQPRVDVYKRQVPFAGSMYFYNYDTGNYDPVKPDKEHFDREELEEYLSPGNTITVRYIYDTTGEYTWNIMLPVLTVTGRQRAVDLKL